MNCKELKKITFFSRDNNNFQGKYVIPEFKKIVNKRDKTWYDCMQFPYFFLAKSEKELFKNFNIKFCFLTLTIQIQNKAN